MVMKVYADRRLSTGFISAGQPDWWLMVIVAINVVLLKSR